MNHIELDVPFYHNSKWCYGLHYWLSFFQSSGRVSLVWDFDVPTLDIAYLQFTYKTVTASRWLDISKRKDWISMSLELYRWLINDAARKECRLWQYLLAEDHCQQKHYLMTPLTLCVLLMWDKHGRIQWNQIYIVFPNCAPNQLEWFISKKFVVEFKKKL